MPDLDPGLQAPSTPAPAPQVDPYTQQLLGNFDRNKGWSKQADYTTPLNPQSEMQFRRWTQMNRVPFNPDAKVSDYDMRGFWRALQAKDPRAMTAVNPYDKQIHYPDYWKTPYHNTFSRESQWATQDAPYWNKSDQLVDSKGKVLFDSAKDKKDRAAKK